MAKQIKRARKPARHCVPVSTLWQILLRSPSAPRACNVVLSKKFGAPSSPTTV